MLSSDPSKKKTYFSIIHDVFDDNDSDSDSVVYVSGSWDNWNTRHIMDYDCDSEIFFTTIELELGIYQYKYIANNKWFHDEHNPTIITEEGYINNIINVENYVFTLENFATTYNILRILSGESSLKYSQ